MTRRSRRGKETAALENATAWNSFNTGGRKQGSGEEPGPRKGRSWAPELKEDPSPGRVTEKERTMLRLPSQVRGVLA